MPTSTITAEGVSRIESARDNYINTLRESNALRCAKPRCGSHPDYAKRVADANRRVKEAFAEWATLFMHETGRKLSVAC
jgi:hypothetical protein